jgi:hypothetical protein
MSSILISGSIVINGLWGVDVIVFLWYALRMHF